MGPAAGRGASLGPKGRWAGTQLTPIAGARQGPERAGMGPTIGEDSDDHGRGVLPIDSEHADIQLVDLHDRDAQDPMKVRLQRVDASALVHARQRRIERGR